MLTLAEAENLLEEFGWHRDQPSPDENPIWRHESWTADEERVTTAEAIAISLYDKTV